MVTLAIPSSYAQLDNESITISTSKTAYGPGDIVNLTGIINEGTPGQLVAIQVKDVKGNLILIRTVQADQNGNFNLQFKVPTTATAGNLNITASARINGFVITQSKETTTPVPEFPASGIVLATSIASLLVFYVLVSNRGLGMKLGGRK
ncbi:hypothetical protein [Candidatus Nitrosotalea sp. TS]|uniref:hypothetical protein n=1 Tax=Candidatus Nitrosotalea sp. TS TaxID=2341020 RepID=UPI001C49B956|nr:hypothetical protein [Candidatus Nitrosotalea sp. TS]